jgi:hypothetical protein
VLNKTKGQLCQCYFLIKKMSLIILRRYQALTMFVRVVIAAGFFVIFVIILVAFFTGNHHRVAPSVKAHQRAVVQHSPASSATGVSDDLIDLQAKLAHVEKMLSSKHSVVNIDQVKQDIKGLNQEITQIEQDNKAQYSALRLQITRLSSQLGGYQKTTTRKLDEIDAIKGKVRCLTAAHLPFTVQSIDLVNGRNVVSVMYADMVSPLENNFTLAGWKLASSNYEHQTARFISRKGVCASVNLNGTF